ncbi:DUF5999 family protein [Streptomyces rhizosphaericus]|uniref:DUF5999 family protein n=1 Tax=Streptomyces rhizosphaericus TaxID=114699 RepID=UPI003555F32A
MCQHETTCPSAKFADRAAAAGVVAHPHHSWRVSCTNRPRGSAACLRETSA